MTDKAAVLALTKGERLFLNTSQGNRPVWAQDPQKARSQGVHWLVQVLSLDGGHFNLLSIVTTDYRAPISPAKHEALSDAKAAS